VTRYFEDFAVGQTFAAGPAEMTEADIVRFAAEFDPQPFHTDPAAAADAFFGGLAASGWHTAALTMRLLVQSGLAPVGGLIGAAVEDMRWPHPVRPGDRLRVETEVREVRPARTNPARGLVRLRTVTFNQDGTPVQVQTSTIVVPRRPGA
jgi:acyl dehydratase